MARYLGWQVSKLSGLKQGKQEASLSDLLGIADYGDLPLESLLDEFKRRDVREHRGVRWRLAGRLIDVCSQELRIAADGVLRGQAPKEIAERIVLLYTKNKLQPPVIDEKRLEVKAQGAVRSGRVELLLTPGEEELEDRALASTLAAALARFGAKPAIHVVRNVCHPDFDYDPMAPILVAIRAHKLVARLLRRRVAILIGLAGGLHCECFARMAGQGSSPFPEGRERRHVSLVPLTLEPFCDHEMALADDVVAELAVRARELLDPEELYAHTVQPFGYLQDGSFVGNSTLAIEQARGLYPRLQVAVFGIGGASGDGWLSRIQDVVEVETTTEPVTDVALHFLDAKGRPIRLPAGRRFVGVDLQHIRRLVRRDDCMALLLTSGAAKGRPLSVVARAGYADTIVCDQAAARAALEVLDAEEPTDTVG